MKLVLSGHQRRELTSVARNGKVEHRIARRANALILLDKGWSCEEVAEAFLIDDDTVRSWHKIYIAGGLTGLEKFESGGSACDLADDQIKAMADWVDETHPTSTRQIGRWIKKSFGPSYSRSGLVKLLSRAGLIFRKPTNVPRTIDADAQRAFIASYEKLLNGLGVDEMVMFMDAVHPSHQSRAVGCWTRRDLPPLALKTNSGRDRMNVHGAIDLSTGQTVMLEAERVDAQTTVRLFERIESRNPGMSTIYVFGDQAAYHKAQEVKEWLNRPERRVKFLPLPTYCPHLNPIERLWGEMHRFVTHNTCYATRKAFCEAILEFLTRTVPNEFHRFRSRITDNFRVIEASDFRVLT